MKKRILVIDDDFETLRMMEFILRHKGYEVFSEPDGANAIARAHEQHPDLIILDVMMPDPNGFEIARTLRHTPETQHIPILFFSARDEIASKLAGFEAGGDDYLAKPMHPAELIARVENLLSMKDSSTS